MVHKLCSSAIGDIICTMNGETLKTRTKTIQRQEKLKLLSIFQMMENHSSHAKLTEGLHYAMLIQMT